MWLEIHFAWSGHIYQHEVTYSIINYLFYQFYVINKSLVIQRKYSVLVLKYFSKYLYLYSSTFENPVLVLVLVLIIFSSTCTCTRVLLSSTRPKPALYRTLVRSSLEYRSSVWSPGKISDTKYFESIQRAATRYILNYPEIEYEQRCTMPHLHPSSCKLQICFMFLNKCMIGYHDVSLYNNIEVLSNSSLRSGIYAWKLLEQGVLKLMSLTL